MDANRRFMITVSYAPGCMAKNATAMIFGVAT